MAWTHKVYSWEFWEPGKIHIKTAEEWMGGKRKGMVTIIEEVAIHSKKRRIRGVLLLCDCGKQFVRPLNMVKNVREPSCGCVRPLSGRHKITHGAKKGGYKEPEYSSWSGAKRRCTATQDAAYHYYGGRGIKFCDRWMNSYQNFIEDMGKKPDPTYTLDRIDCDGDYSPENCRWASKVTQGRNRRNVVWIEVAGQKVTAKGFMELTLLSEFKIRDFLKKGMTGDEIVRHMYGVLGKLIKT